MTSAIVPPIICNQPDDVAEVTALDGFRLHVRFCDGLEGQVDMRDLVHSPRAGVFERLADPARFAEAFVEYGAVMWPGEIDLAPMPCTQKSKNTENGSSNKGVTTSRRVTKQATVLDFPAQRPDTSSIERRWEKTAGRRNSFQGPSIF
jgi:hypothetical protein